MTVLISQTEPSNISIISDGEEVESLFQSKTLWQAILIIVITVCVIIGNVLIIGTIVTTKSMHDVIGYYLVSLAIVDLLCGVLVTPLSIYPALSGNWVYGKGVCKLEAYLEVMLWNVSVYTFIWISVDRYLAIRKPMRYEAMQTKIRCKCWIAFTWITAIFLCCPPLFGYAQAKYLEHAFICVIDWGYMVAYSITLGILIIIPTCITICYTYYFIFKTMLQLRRQVDHSTKGHITSMSENLANPNHVMSFVIIVVFMFSWLPWILLQTYELVIGPVNHPYLQFGVLWVAIMACFWKFVIYVLMCPKFREGLKNFCLCNRCNQEEDEDSSTNTTSNNVSSA